MSIFRVPKGSNNPFFMMDNNIINNPKLSLQATAVLTYLISKPDDWNVRISDIISHFSNGQTSIRNAINELVFFGYLVRNPVRHNNGKFIRHDYIIHENPYFSNPHFNKPVKSKSKPLRRFQQMVHHSPTNTKRKNKTDPVTTKSYNKSNTLSVAQNHQFLKESKHSTKLLLFEFGIKNCKKLFDMFPDFDIFCYVDWMMPFKSKIRNKMGYLITALREKWSEPELFRKSREPLG